MAENKTKPTSISVDTFLTTVDDKRQAEARILIKLMQQISGEKPVMWGPSIIGFGTQHYKSEAGKEGDTALLGFSPRKTSLTIYFYEGFDRYGKELEKLGKHKTSKGCLYINKLADIDREVLTSMVQQSYLLATTPQKKIMSVNEYIESIPNAARAKFDELRELVRDAFPEGNEVVSYGIIGYKQGDKRARVFVSGWKDHVAMYPVPKDPDLQRELAPYIRGKGTLWFSLDAPLPKKLLQDAVQALTSTGE